MILPGTVFCFLSLVSCLFHHGNAQTDSLIYLDHLLIKTGDSLLIFEQYDAASLHFKNALSVMQKKADHAGYLYALNQLARTAIKKDHFSDAEKFLRKADLFWESHPGLSLGRGGTLRLRGVYYGEQEKDSLSQIYFEHSIALLESCCTAQAQELGNVFLDYALTLEHSNPHKSEELAHKALHCFDKQYDRFNQLKKAATYVLLGGLAREHGDTELHTRYNEAAESNVSSFDPPPYSLNKSLLYSLGEQYVDLRDWSKAISTYDKIIELITLQKGVHSSELLFPLANIGHTLVNLKNPLAFQYLNEAESVFLKSKEDILFLGFIHHQLAKYYTNENLGDKARYYFESATNKYLQGSASTYLESLNTDRAEISLRQNKPGEALAFSDLALQFAGYQEQEVFNPSVLESRNIDLYFDPMELRSRILHKLYENTGDHTFLYQSLESSNTIEKIAEFTRNGSYSENTKQIVSEHFHRGAQGALNTLATLNSIAPKIEYVNSAFNFIEHNRYAQLFQDLKRSEAFSEVDQSEEIAKQINYYRAEIQRLQFIEQENKKENKSGTEVADSIIELIQDFHQFQQKIKEKHPGEYQLRYDSMLSLDQVQQNMVYGTQILEYFWGDSDLICLAITKDTALLVSLDHSDISQALNRLLPWLITGYVADSLELNYREYATLTYDLYQALIGHQLQQGINKLVISADGLLSNLPFGVLVTDTSTAAANFLDAPYLIRQVEIQYAYSSNLLFKRTEMTPLNKPRVLAMAYSDDQTTNGTSQNEFSELPYASQEVDLISKLFGSSATTIKGVSATKNVFLSAASKMDILHLAIHGIGDTLSPVHSHLIFNSGNSTEDGRLFAHELYNLPPNQWRLVVLSACESGVGKNLEGEGTFSIARGFAYSGAPSLVMSLWNVNDQATARIMQRFYRHLRKGVSASKALQQAKIDFLGEQNPETFRPFFWAGLVAMGDDGAVVKANVDWFYSFIIFFLSLIVFYYFHHKFWLSR